MRYKRFQHEFEASLRTKASGSKVSKCMRIESSIDARWEMQTYNAKEEATLRKQKLINNNI